MTLQPIRIRSEELQVGMIVIQAGGELYDEPLRVVSVDHEGLEREVHLRNIDGSHRRWFDSNTYAQATILIDMEKYQP